MYKSLNQYIERLRSEGELIEIEEYVNPELEICEITERVSKEPGGGKAILFKNTGTYFPVLTNMMGSDKRICMALDVTDLNEVGAKIEKIFKNVSSPKNSLFDKLKMLPLLNSIGGYMPKKQRGRGKCQEVIDRNPNLKKLPILKCWAHDGGRFVTLPLVHTEDPVTGIRNVGMYRMQVFSDNETGMHWHTHKTGERHFSQYKRLKKRMPITVCLGGDPVYTYSATAPLPDGIDEYMLAGFIREKAVKLVKCITNDLYVPSDCDFVIEGYVDPSEEKMIEGPFGDHTGFYSLEDYFPKFTVTCITHRKGAVYPATIVGIPPQEDAYIAKATEKIFLAPIRITMLPEIMDLHMPIEGTAHNIAIASIDKTYVGQPFKVASSMWGAGQMMFNKFFFILPHDADLRDYSSLAKFVSCVKIPRDVMFSKGPLDILDHTSDQVGFGGKMAIDATGIPVNSIVKIPEKWEYTDEFVWIDDCFCKEWSTLFVAVSENCIDIPKSVKTLLNNNNATGIKFVLAYNHNVPKGDVAMLIWLAGANCDAVRDVTVDDTMLILDATVKREKKGFTRRFPNIVTTDLKTIKAINAKNIKGIPKHSTSEKYLKMVESDSAAIE